MKHNSDILVDQYIGQFDYDLQTKLNKMRQLVHELVPGVTESLSYQIPTYKLKGKALVHFAAYKTHIGFYPTPSVILAFRDKLGDYKTSKGAIQFSLEKDLPLELVRDIIQYRVAEVMTGS